LRREFGLHKCDVVKCPVCGENVLKQKGNTKELRDKITLFEKDKTISYCKRCGNPVEVPIQLVK
jgi:ribosomal protein S27E